MQCHDGKEFYGKELSYIKTNGYSWRTFDKCLMSKLINDFLL